MNADIRIYPDKELKAVDMAVMLDALSVTDGVIQGCDVTLTSGHLHIEDGRILIKGRLGVVTAGDIEIPTLAASATCRLLAVCDLAIDSPFYLSLFPATEYDALVERCEAITDFNAMNGVAFIELGQAEVDASTGTVTLWTPNTKVSAFRATNPYFERMGGNYLPNGTNIDTIGREYSGWWVYDRSNVSGTFPITDNYGTFGHIQGTSENIAMQFIRSNSQVSSDHILYIRYKTNGVWDTWQRLVSANPVALPIFRVDNPYCTVTDIAPLSAVKKSGFLWIRGDLWVTNDVPNNGVNYRIATIAGWDALNTIDFTVTNIVHKATILVTISHAGDIFIANRSPQTQPGGSFNGGYPFITCVPCKDGRE